MQKNAIITGASTGIGEAVARKLAANGISVALASRNVEKLQSIAADIQSQGGKAIAIQTDVSKRADMQALAKEASAQLGPIDILVNNAGVMLSAKVTDGDVAAWEQMIDVNVKGILYGLDEIVPDMIARKTGHIFNISSVAGHEVTKLNTVYAATKFAVRTISAGLEKELARTGVRVTNISPGMVDTNLSAAYKMDRKKLDAANIADAIAYAIEQPAHVNVNEITIRPV